MQKFVLTIESVVPVLVWIVVWDHYLRGLNSQFRERVVATDTVGNSKRSAEGVCQVQQGSA